MTATPDQNFASAIETLIGGTADRFVTTAGPGLPVVLLSGPDAKTALGVTDGAPGEKGDKGDTGNTGATGPAGPNTVTSSTTTNLTGVLSGNGSVVGTTAFGTAAGQITEGNDSRLREYFIQVALSGNGQNISSGAKKGLCRVPRAGTITGFAVICDPANEPSAIAVQVDLNTVNKTTGVATSVLSSAASIATGANESTGGAISGSPSVAVGDILSIDVDQGSDGRELVATITILATT